MLEIANCVKPKEIPQTNAAGQISFVARAPAKAQISQNGTITENSGNCRPTMAPSLMTSSPVAAASPTIGVPSAPNATGAVLAMSERPAAASGEKPSPIRIAPRSEEHTSELQSHSDLVCRL